MKHGIWSAAGGRPAARLGNFPEPVVEPVARLGKFPEPVVEPVARLGNFPEPVGLILKVYIFVYL